MEKGRKAATWPDEYDLARIEYLHCSAMAVKIEKAHSFDSESVKRRQTLTVLRVRKIDAWRLKIYGQFRRILAVLWIRRQTH